MVRNIFAGAAALLVTLTGVAFLTLSPTNTTPVEKADTMSQADSEHNLQHLAWTRLLSLYVHPSDDGVNRLDYSALQAHVADSAALDNYIAAMSGLDFETLNDDEAFAAWANLYNALTVRLIIDNLPLKSITRIRPSPFAIGPWKQKIVTIGAQALSLDDIEHTILRQDWDEPRVHYAVNCASYSCPNLRTAAWVAETLDQDLTEAAKDYINHPRAVRVRADGRLVLSTIYKWYQEDFGDSKAGVIAHLLEYADADLAAQIRAKPDIANYDYDWSLNEIDASSPTGANK